MNILYGYGNSYVYQTIYLGTSVSVLGKLDLYLLLNFVRDTG